MSVQVFLSYAHEDGETVARLAEELQARGLRTWQDINDIRLGKRIESEMERGIARCDAVLHVLTPAAVESEAVRREIDLALGRRRRDDSFLVLAAARGLGDGHEDVGRFTLREFGDNFARDWLELLTPGVEPVTPDEAAGFARKVLRSFFPQGDGAADGTWRMGLHARGSAGAGHDLELDWRPLLGTDERNAGDYDAWRRAWRALRDVRDVLCDHAERRSIVLDAVGHQTAGILFGLAFCSNAGFELLITGQDRDEWRRGSPQGGIGAYTTNRQPESLDGSYLTVEIEVARTVLAAVSERIAELGEEPRARMLVFQPNGPAWVTPEIGANLARAIAAEVKRAVDDLRVARIEIYPAAPFPLCVLFGSELGAVHAELALFEFHGGRYEPSLVVPEGER